jgi:hypothetical protein
MRYLYFIHITEFLMYFSFLLWQIESLRFLNINPFIIRPHYSIASNANNYYEKSCQLNEPASRHTLSI